MHSICVAERCLSCHGLLAHVTCVGVLENVDSQPLTQSARAGSPCHETIILNSLSPILHYLKSDLTRPRYRYSKFGIVCFIAMILTCPLFEFKLMLQLDRPWWPLFGGIAAVLICMVANTFAHRRITRIRSLRGHYLATWSAMIGILWLVLWPVQFIAAFFVIWFGR